MEFCEHQTPSNKCRVRKYSECPYKVNDIHLEPINYLYALKINECERFKPASGLEKRLEIRLSNQELKEIARINKEFHDYVKSLLEK